MVAEELGKIVSAQQIFVLRKAIYRLTAHSTNPHAVLYAHLPLRSASGALRQRNAPKPLSRLPRLRSASGALRQSTTYSHSPVWYPLRSARGALRQRFRFLLSGQAEPRSAFCRRSGRQAPHPGILCHAAGGRLRDPRGDRGDQRLPPPSEKMEGDDNSAAGRGAGPADRGAAPGTGLPVRIFQMRHFRGSGAGILLPRE